MQINLQSIEKRLIGIIGNIGRNLERIRLENGLTLKEISSKLKIDLKLYEYYEAGFITPNLFFISKFCEFFDISVNDFFN